MNATRVDYPHIHDDEDADQITFGQSADTLIQTQYNADEVSVETDFQDEQTPLLRHKRHSTKPHPYTKSTFSQSVANTVNLLVGLALLSMPYTLKTGGWIYGVGTIVFGGVSTLYTAFLLIKCMKLDSTIQSLGDIGQFAFGNIGRFIVSSIYVLELTSCGISYVLVVSDSLKAIFSSVDLLHLQFIAAGLMIVTSLIESLAVLSFASLMGLLASSLLLLITIYDGLSVTESPGSLWSPMPTKLWPDNWMAILNIGLIVYCYSGHSIVPAIYKDMKNPEKFPSMIITSYVVELHQTKIRDDTQYSTRYYCLNRLQWLVGS